MNNVMQGSSDEMNGSFTDLLSSENVVHDAELTQKPEQKTTTSSVLDDVDFEDIAASKRRNISA